MFTAQPFLSVFVFFFLFFTGTNQKFRIDKHHTTIEIREHEWRLRKYVNSPCGLSDSHSKNDLVRCIYINLRITATEKLRKRKGYYSRTSIRMPRLRTKPGLFKFSSKVAHCWRLFVFLFYSILLLFLFLFPLLFFLFVLVFVFATANSTRDAKLSAYKYRKRQRNVVHEFFCVTVIWFALCLSHSLARSLFAQIHAAPKTGWWWWRC